MYSEIKQRADKLVGSQSPDVLSARKIGLEKESLRVSASGGISQADHPQALGSALTHPSITTDFSEALLEMVTPPCDSAEDALHYLNAIHQFIVERLPENEHIWNTSMPCILRGGQSVRIGEYGNSFSGRMKHAYRRGLALRYGRRMQAIAGIHFNFSMPETSWGLRQSLLEGGNPIADDTPASQALRTEGYFGMMQNLLRIGWVVPYLFGASPAICSSFLAEGEGEEFDVWNQSTRYAPYGTSLRMGKIGYRYNEEEPIDLTVRHTDVDAYIQDIIGHVSTEHPPYKALGLRDDQGRLQQLSTARLQIENEYYSSVRPKQIARSGELPIYALRERGIRYLELRSVDVNVDEPTGISLQQTAMLEMLMMFAWLGEPAPLSVAELERCTDNVQRVAHQGREPGLVLMGPTGDIPLAQWGRSIIDALEPVAHWLDSARSEPLYLPSLMAQRAKFDDPELTPSASMIRGIKQTGSFFEYVQKRSIEHDRAFTTTAVDEQVHQELADRVKESVVKQAELEAGSAGSFDEFLANYLGQIHPQPEKA